MLSLLISYLLIISIKCEIEDGEDALNELLEHEFPFYQFNCAPNAYAYETEFTFLRGLGRGFVHAEGNRIFFEYYFPTQHWVGFASADQSIAGEEDTCSACYYEYYYPKSPDNTNHSSNLYPQCIEECLDDTIFVSTVNSDDQNLNDWSLIEFQISAQLSKKLNYKSLVYKSILILAQQTHNNHISFRNVSNSSIGGGIGSMGITILSISR